MVLKTSRALDLVHAQARPRILSARLNFSCKFHRDVQVFSPKYFDLNVTVPSRRLIARFSRPPARHAKAEPEARSSLVASSDGPPSRPGQCPR